MRGPMRVDTFGRFQHALGCVAECALRVGAIDRHCTIQIACSYLNVLNKNRARLLSIRVGRIGDDIGRDGVRGCTRGLSDATFGTKWRADETRGPVSEMDYRCIRIGL